MWFFNLMWRAVSFPFFPARKSWCSCLLLSVASTTKTENPGSVAANVVSHLQSSWEETEFTDDLQSQPFQSFWENSPRCCSAPLVLLERGERMKKIGFTTIVSLDRDLLHLAGRLQAQGETLREGSGGNPTRVAGKGTGVSLLNTRIIFSYSLRMFEAGNDECWPVT